MKLNRSEIDTLIFDMDGVITGEQTYWNAAALTVYELFYSHTYYGKQDIDREWCRKHYQEIYDTVFCYGKTVKAIKRLGVNTNWDLAYVVFCVAKYLDPELDIFDHWHFESVCMFIENMTIRPPELYPGVEGLLATALPGDKGCYQRTHGLLWRQLLDSFQRWYHGDDRIEGLKVDETPIVPLENLKTTLQSLKEVGFRMGIGTGRPLDEIVYPLTQWGLDGYFDLDCWVAYNQVQEAEKELPEADSLAKPHPYVFLKSAFGTEYTDRQIYEGVIPAEKRARCMAVGDAAADIFAAQNGGMKFAAVLTGVEGEEARGFFEENHADMILNSVLDLKVEA